MHSDLRFNLNSDNVSLALTLAPKLFQASAARKSNESKVRVVRDFGTAIEGPFLKS